MADTFSEGYRIGFVNTGKDLSKKSVVNIYYAMGFERIVKKAIENFAKMGLKPSIFRTSHSVIRSDFSIFPVTSSMSMTTEMISGL